MCCKSKITPGEDTFCIKRVKKDFKTTSIHSFHISQPLHLQPQVAYGQSLQSQHHSTISCTFPFFMPKLTHRIEICHLRVFLPKRFNKLLLNIYFKVDTAVQLGYIVVGATVLVSRSSFHAQYHSDDVIS